MLRHKHARLIDGANAVVEHILSNKEAVVESAPAPQVVYAPEDSDMISAASANYRDIKAIRYSSIAPAAGPRSALDDIAASIRTTGMTAADEDTEIVTLQSSGAW